MVIQLIIVDGCTNKSAIAQLFASKYRSLYNSVSFEKDEMQYIRSSFFYRYLDCWSALPVYVRQSSSLTSFKRQINLLDLRKYLKGSATDIN